MGEILFELERVLRTKQHKLTIQEANLILNCKSKAFKDYCVGAAFGGGISWIATSRLSFFGRISISAGASALMGLWKLGRSLDSCVDQILALEGSRMQRELANIVVTKHRNDPWRMGYVSKHFYSEEVFDDSDKPKLRWRYRNFFSDSFDNGQSNSDESSHGDSSSESHRDYNSETHSGSHDTRAEPQVDSVPKKVPVDPAVDPTDPLDCVFGDPTVDEIRDPTNNPSTTSSRTQTRKDRRAHRRRRIRHHQDV